MNEGSEEGIPKKIYERELKRLHLELIKLQQWVRNSDSRVAIIFEGRDAAGKGGVIKRIMSPLNPRFCRVVALGTPSDKERPNGISRDMSSIYQPPVKS